MIPYWYVFVVAAVCVGAGWLTGRGRLNAERQLRIAAEADARRYTVGRAQVQAAVAVDPEPTVQIARSGDRMPPRVGIVLPDTVLMPTVAADFPPPGNVAGSDATAILARTLEPPEDDEAKMRKLLDSVLQLEAEGHAEEPQRRDWAAMHDVEGVEDEPSAEPDDDDQPQPPQPPPTGCEPLRAEVPPPAKPRYGWAHLTGQTLDPPGPWRPTVEWSEKPPIRMRRLYSPLRVWLASHVPGPLRRLWDAAHEFDPPGFAPGVATALVRSGPPLPSLRTRRQHVGDHRPEEVQRRALSASWRTYIAPVQSAETRLPMIGCAR